MIPTHILGKEIDDLRVQLASVYTERARLLAIISNFFPSSIEKHQKISKTPAAGVVAEAAEDWLVLLIKFPNFVGSWHISETDIHLFSHLPFFTNHLKYDGHTTEEKYLAIERMIEDGKTL